MRVFIYRCYVYLFCNLVKACKRKLISALNEVVEFFCLFWCVLSRLVLSYVVLLSCLLLNFKGHSITSDVATIAKSRTVEFACCTYV